MDFLNHSNQTFIQLLETRVSFQSQLNRSFAELHNSPESPKPGRSLYQDAG